MSSETMTMSFTELHCFREVARSGGITAAAERLALSKSSVSKYITRLEERLGVKVLERSSRRVHLTPAGERLLPRVESIVADGQLLVEQALEELADPSGLVRVAATPEFGAIVAQRFFPSVVARYPALRLTMTSAYAMEDLQDPHYDFALRIGQVRDERLVARKMGSFRRIAVVSPSFAAEHPLSSPEELSALPCLIFSDRRNESTWTFVRRDDLDSSAPIEVPVQGPLSVLNFTTILAMAERGLGVAYVPYFLAGESIERGRLIRCLAEHCSRPTPVFLAYRVGSERIRRVGVVLEMAREQLPRLIAEDDEAT
ncbi:MAG: LysR family transcriptional regulator [Myxococcales bacterium]|nr:LysR family transcriptional regulator [Myxococcales bacterium]